MARHRANEGKCSTAIAVGITWGLAIITGVGFAVAWIALPLLGVAVMAVSGGSLAMVLR